MLIKKDKVIKKGLERKFWIDDISIKKTNFNINEFVL